MSALRHDPPHLPTELILIILDKSRELLESDVDCYVKHHKQIFAKGFPNQDQSVKYLLYHSHLGFDDCVFWHQCWTYTALRLIDRSANHHVSRWANSSYIDKMIREYELTYDLEHSDHSGLQSFERYVTGPLSRLASRLWPDTEYRRERLWSRRNDVVPIWNKYREAHFCLPEGAQTLPWETGYDKAAAYCCIHLDHRRIVEESKGKPVSTLQNGGDNTRPNSYFRPLRSSFDTRLRIAAAGMPAPVDLSMPPLLPAPGGSDATTPNFQNGALAGPFSTDAHLQFSHDLRQANDD